jgi:hypothetical protein
MHREYVALRHRIGVKLRMIRQPLGDRGASSGASMLVSSTTQNCPAVTSGA